jgi:hypothetical protein
VEEEQLKNLKRAPRDPNERKQMCGRRTETYGGILVHVAKAVSVVLMGLSGGLSGMNGCCRVRGSVAGFGRHCGADGDGGLSSEQSRSDGKVL